MKVKLIQSASFAPFFRAESAGELIDVEAEIGQKLIEAKIAVPVADEKKETAVAKNLSKETR